jgi:hypothetical protein
VGINEMWTKRTIQWNKIWFFEKINEIVKPLAKLTKRNREDSN